MMSAIAVTTVRMRSNGDAGALSSAVLEAVAVVAVCGTTG
jgi:hypothetical protein